MTTRASSQKSDLIVGLRESFLTLMDSRARRYYPWFKSRLIQAQDIDKFIIQDQDIDKFTSNVTAFFTSDSGGWI